MISESLVTATIANGASLSGAVNLRGARLAAIVMPADWTAADLSFQAGIDATTLFNVYDEADAEVVVQAADDRFIILDPHRWRAVRTLKIRSGTAGSPVAQGGDRAITLIAVSG